MALTEANQSGIDMNWDDVRKSFESLAGRQIDPQLPIEMADLAVRLGNNPAFADVRPGKSLATLTLDHPHSKRRILVSWERPRFYAVSFKDVTLEDALQAVRDCLQHIRDSETFDESLSIGETDLVSAFGKLVVGWKNVLAFYNAQLEKPHQDTRYIKSVLKLLPKLKKHLDLQPEDFWSVSSYALLGLTIQGSKRTILIGGGFQYAISTYERLTATPSQVIPVLEDFVNRL